MKSNVDLTQDMIFSNPRARINIFSLRNLLIKKNYPWDMDKGTFSTITTDSLVLVGNKQNRKYIKMGRKYASAELGCERCGANISQKPWNREGCLCIKCSQELSISYQEEKQPWTYSNLVRATKRL
jgi:hypothetical protein